MTRLSAWLGIWGAGIIALAPGPGSAENSDPPATSAPAPAPVPDLVSLGTDASTRMTVAVNISGRGPFPFVIDTGSQRTVISRELAERLDLASGPVTRMHSMTGAQSVATAIIPSLEVNNRAVRNIHAPALLRAHIGAAGILGIDSLRSQRVMLDFKAGTMAVESSTVAADTRDGDTIIVRARSRLGQLVLADADADGERIWVIIDTGAQVSIGNEALRRRLARPDRASLPVELVSVTGGTMPAEYTTLGRIRLGGIHIDGLPVAFANAHPFRQLDLQKRPALLLGMDALRLFDRVAVDFAKRNVQFMLNGGRQLRGGLAATSPPLPREDGRP